MVATSSTLVEKQALLESMRLDQEAARIETEVARLRAETHIHEVNRSVVLMENFGDLVDIRDYIYDEPGFGYGQVVGPIATLQDRLDGCYFPIYRTEQECAMIRGLGRLLCGAFPIAIGIQTNLNCYEIGVGGTYKASAKANKQCPPELLLMVQNVIDDLDQSNQFVGNLEEELAWRAREDGEFFLELKPNGWHTALRVREPEQITDPQGNFAQELERWLGTDFQHESSWSFGIHTPKYDPQMILGYHLIYSLGGIDYEYVKSDRMVHYKRNVPRGVKRGVSDFYPVRAWLEDAEKLLGNTQKGSAIQAAIAYVREYADGTTASQADAVRKASSINTITQPTPNGGRTVNVSKINSGNVVDARGFKYVNGPLAANGAPEGAIAVLQAALRYIGIRWAFPEYMISGDASNANMASTLVAESPFVKARESGQRKLSVPFIDIHWKAIKIAHTAGYFRQAGVTFDELRELVEIKADYPTVASRDRIKEAQASKIESDAGILSKPTWSAQAGYDFEQEQKLGAQVAADPNAMGPDGKPMGGGQGGQGPGGSAPGSQNPNGYSSQQTGQQDDFDEGGGQWRTDGQITESVLTSLQRVLDQNDPHETLYEAVATAQKVKGSPDQWKPLPSPASKQQGGNYSKEPAGGVLNPPNAAANKPAMKYGDYPVDERIKARARIMRAGSAAGHVGVHVPANDSVVVREMERARAAGDPLSTMHTSGKGSVVKSNQLPPKQYNTEQQKYIDQWGGWAYKAAAQELIDEGHSVPSLKLANGDKMGERVNKLRGGNPSLQARAEGGANGADIAKEYFRRKKGGDPAVSKPNGINTDDLDAMVEGVRNRLGSYRQKENIQAIRDLLNEGYGPGDLNADMVFGRANADAKARGSRLPNRPSAIEPPRGPNYRGAALANQSSLDRANAKPIVAVEPANVRKNFDENLHPRGDNGRWIKKAEIEEAQADPGKAKELIDRVNDPLERKKLFKALGRTDLDTYPTLPPTADLLKAADELNVWWGGQQHTEEFAEDWRVAFNQILSANYGGDLAKVQDNRGAAAGDIDRKMKENKQAAAIAAKFPPKKQLPPDQESLDIGQPGLNPREEGPVTAHGRPSEGVGKLKIPGRLVDTAEQDLMDKRANEEAARYGRKQNPGYTAKDANMENRDLMRQRLIDRGMENPDDVDIDRELDKWDNEVSKERSYQPLPPTDNQGLLISGVPGRGWDQPAMVDARNRGRTPAGPVLPDLDSVARNQEVYKLDPYAKGQGALLSNIEGQEKGGHLMQAIAPGSYQTPEEVAVEHETSRVGYLPGQQVFSGTDFPKVGGGVNSAVKTRLKTLGVSSLTTIENDGNVNETKWMTLADGTVGLFKPRNDREIHHCRNEMSDLSCEREAATSDVADILGLSEGGMIVPATVVREDNDGNEGSFMVKADDCKNAVKFLGEDMYDGEENEEVLGAFDYLIGHSDRHYRNWMMPKSHDMIYAIDNGLTMPDNNKDGFLHNAMPLYHLEHRDAVVPDIVHKWAGMLPQIEAVYRGYGFDDSAIAAMAERMEALTTYAGSTFGDLKQGGPIKWAQGHYLG